MRTAHRWQQKLTAVQMAEPVLFTFGEWTLEETRQLHRKAEQHDFLRQVCCTLNLPAQQQKPASQEQAEAFAQDASQASSSAGAPAAATQSPPAAETLSPAAETKPAAPAKPMSWANLVKSSANDAPSNPAAVPASRPAQAQAPAPVPNGVHHSGPKSAASTAEEDSSDQEPQPMPAWWDTLLDAASPKNGTIPGGITSIQPRGLLNQGNTCFMNSILQCLLACHPLVCVLAQLVKLTETNDLVPKMEGALQSFIMFFREVTEQLPEPSPTTKRSYARATNQSSVVQPARHFGELLRTFRQQCHEMPPAALSTAAVGAGSQEDAEEWLGFLINGMHEEMLTAIPLRKGTGRRVVEATTKTTGEEDEWQEMGRNNKLSVTRTVEVVQSPITTIFGGQLRTVVQSHGSKASVTIEPFHCLNLDCKANDASSLDDTLSNFMAPETLEHFTCAKTHREVQASRQSVLHQLPRVLVLHLKRFTFDRNGPHKVHKHISYPEELVLQPQQLSSALEASLGAGPKYRLFAVVSHHGKSLLGGHYTCDASLAKEGGGTEWYHFDDNHVSTVPITEVLQRQAYVLFYQQLPT